MNHDKNIDSKDGTSSKDSALKTINNKAFQDNIAQIEAQQQKLLNELMGNIPPIKQSDDKADSNHPKANMSAQKNKKLLANGQSKASQSPSIHSKWNHLQKIVPDDSNSPSPIKPKKLLNLKEDINETQSIQLSRQDEKTPANGARKETSLVRSGGFRNRRGDIHDDRLSEDSSLDNVSSKQRSNINLSRNMPINGTDHADYSGFHKNANTPRNIRKVSEVSRNSVKDTPHNAHKPIGQETSANLGKGKIVLKTKQLNQQEKKFSPQYNLMQRNSFKDNTNDKYYTNPTGLTKRSSIARGFEEKDSTLSNKASLANLRSKHDARNKPVTPSNKEFSLKLKAQRVDFQGHPYSSSDSSEHNQPTPKSSIYAIKSRQHSKNEL